MACTDDDVEPRGTRIDSFRAEYLPYMAADTPEDMTRSRLSAGRAVIEQHYIPFPRDECHPIGCTRSHVFAVIRTEGKVYTPICMHLVHKYMVLPSHCVSPRREFISPWKKYSEAFVGFLGGCAHEDLMCLVLRGSVIVISATWKVSMRDNHITLSTLVSCTMNRKYLVVVGVETGKTEQSMFIYDVMRTLPRRIYYNNAVKPPIRAVSLLNNIDQAILVQCESGRTRRMLIEESDRTPHCTIRDVGDLTTARSTEKPSLTKELAQSSRIVQLIGTDLVLVKNRNDVDRTNFLSQMIVDVVDYEDGIVAVHDADNSLHFFTSKLAHVVSVPWESIAAASLLYENGVPSILRPYSSMGRCLDEPGVIVMLASFGALVTIKML